MAAVRADDPGLHKKLVWLTFFRVVSVTVLLGGAAAVAWDSERGLDATGPIFGLVIVTYGVSIVAGLLLRSRPPPARLEPIAWAHVAVDVALAAAVVALTGGAESVFVFMYSLGIVSGAILLYRRGARVAAALAIGAQAAVVVASAGPARIPFTLLFVQGSAFAVTGALASYLSEQLRSTGERLAARERDLAAITALHESIVESVTSGLVTLDAAGRITFVNRAGEQMTGLSRREAVGRPAERWFAAFRTDEPRGETDLETPAGARLRIGYSSFRLLGRAGEPIGTAIIFQDLTELRAMEDRVARNQRLADLGRVAAGLAHELRNPLAAMMGAVELLAETVAGSPEDARLLGIVQREGGRLDALVSDFLAYARPRPPRRLACDLAAVAAETLDAFANDPAAQRVELRRALEHAPASCDPDQIRQVLWNLLVNAAHAAAGGDGEADGRAGVHGTVRVSCAPSAGGGARLEVEDDGPGIPPGDRARLFTPFFTTRQGGTGLGLATVHAIVDAHGGAVTVESEPGRGARFVVQLPPAPRAAAAETR
jgi:two-component system sensor histidine kinase PilS (NtrC family)